MDNNEKAVGGSLQQMFAHDVVNIDDENIVKQLKNRGKFDEMFEALQQLFLAMDDSDPMLPVFQDKVQTLWYDEISSPLQRNILSKLVEDGVAEWSGVDAHGNMVAKVTKPDQLGKMVDGVNNIFE